MLLKPISQSMQKHNSRLGVELSFKLISARPKMSVHDFTEFPLI